MDLLRARTTLLARLLGNSRTEVSVGSEGVKITGGSRGAVIVLLVLSVVVPLGALAEVRWM